MNKQVSRIPQQKLKNLLILFCLLSGGFSIYLAVHAVLGPGKRQPVFEVKQIYTPKHYNRSGSEIDETQNYVGEDLYREIQDYKRYMDSLGQPIRPGLADSIRILEQIYNSQNK